MKELVYTSAPAGLRPGTSGFCTVAMSDDLSAPAVEFLERLSNIYRPVYMPFDPRAADNPVAYSLVRARLGGPAVLVLSRNAAAGADHTGRSNNLAHHLVFDGYGPGDGSNPAATAAQTDTFRTRWNEGPRRLPPRHVNGAPGPRSPCRTWEDVTGDAGWAGPVAAAWASRDSRPVYLIYPPGTDVLDLLAEAISLVPVDRRWECTFTTYYTGLSPEVTCAVRGVLAGSPHEAEARRGEHIDLADLVGAAPGGLLADRARGRAVEEAEAARPIAVAAPPIRRPRPATVHAPVLADDDAIDEPPPPTPPPRPRRRRDPEPELVDTPAGGGKAGWILAALFGPLFLATGAAGTVIALAQREARQTAEQERDEARQAKADVEKRLAEELRVARADRDRADQRSQDAEAARARAQSELAAERARNKGVGPPPTPLPRVDHRDPLEWLFGAPDRKPTSPEVNPVRPEIPAPKPPPVPLAPKKEPKSDGSTPKEQARLGDSEVNVLLSTVDADLEKKPPAVADALAKLRQVVDGYMVPRGDRAAGKVKDRVVSNLRAIADKYSDHRTEAEDLLAKLTR